MEKFYHRSILVDSGSIVQWSEMSNTHCTLLIGIKQSSALGAIWTSNVENCTGVCIIRQVLCNYSESTLRVMEYSVLVAILRLILSSHD